MVSVLLRERNLLFLHVPKTAGGSISRALRAAPDAAVYSVRNMNTAEPCSAQLQRRLGCSLTAYHTAAFVRNPWDWTVSGYLHVTQNMPAYSTPPSFEDFLFGDWQHADILQYPTKFSTPKAYVAYHTQITQWEHLCTPNGAMDINHIGRFETLIDDTASIFGGHLSLTHANKSERTAYQDYYNSQTKALVAERNAPLIEHFGYRFDRALTD